MFIMEDLGFIVSDRKINGMKDFCWVSHWYFNGWFNKTYLVVGLKKAKDIVVISSIF